jgi:selenium metabolism protein YedF
MEKVVFVNSDRIGEGDDELGAKLMGSFLYSLARTEVRPEAVIFMNAGVTLTCRGSEALDDLRLLSEDGVYIYSCGTCLDWLELTDQLAVGEVGTMSDTVELFMTASDVVSVG